MSCLLLSFLLVFPTARNTTYPADMSGMTAADILQIDDFRFSVAAQRYSIRCIANKETGAVPGLWQLLNKTQADKDPLVRSSLVEAICLLGGAADREKILSMAEATTSDYARYHTYLAPCSKWWIERELGRVAAGPKPTTTTAPAPPPDLPVHLRNAPPGLQDAWRQYKGATARFHARFNPRREGEWIYYQENKAAFLRLVTDFLRGNRDEIIESIGKYHWGGGCGTGSETLCAPRYRMLFMGLLNQGDYSTALGALLVLDGLDRNDMDLLGQDSSRQARQFMELCGWDWETVYAGGAVDDLQRIYLQRLATYGSERAARYLADMASLDIPNGDRRAYLNAVAAFVEPSGGKAPLAISGDFPAKRQNKVRLTQELDRKLLDILIAEVQRSQSPEIIECVTSQLRRLSRPETKDALRQILTSPSLRGREIAARALKAMGEDVAIPSRPKPVRFRLLMDGQPLARARVTGELDYERGSRHSMSQTDAQGVIGFDRESFLDQSKPLTSIRFRSPTLKRLGDSYIDVSIAPPTDLDATIDVQVPTAQLTLNIRLNREASLYEGKSMVVRLASSRQLVRGSGYSWFQPILDDLTGPVEPKVVFPHISSGRYEITLLVPGAALWKSAPIDVADKPVDLDVKLERGADLHCEFVTPEGIAVDQSSVVKLRSGGTGFNYPYYDYRTNTYRGLPRGQYELKVCTGKELAEKSGRFGRGPRAREIQVEPALYEGFTRTIVIDDKSPAIIDLGTIRLKPRAITSPAAEAK